MKVLKHDVDLNLNGINISQKYKSKIVEIDACFGSSKFKIEAVTIPKINISLNISCLGDIVKRCSELGLKLADSFLNVSDNEVTGLDFILGTKGAFCLPESDTLIGYDVMSVYSNTPCGVLLRGDACLLYTSPSPRDKRQSRMPSSA